MNYDQCHKVLYYIKYCFVQTTSDHDFRDYQRLVSVYYGVSSFILLKPVNQT